MNWTAIPPEVAAELATLRQHKAQWAKQIEALQLQCASEEARAVRAERRAEELWTFIHGANPPGPWWMEAPPPGSARAQTVDGDEYIKPQT